MDATAKGEGAASITSPFSGPDTWVHLVGTWDSDTSVNRYFTTDDVAARRSAHSVRVIA